MYNLLSGLTVVEASSFVAGPSCALHLQQMGARVIRLDAIGGGLDHRRWPLAANDRSLFWEGLNKGKQSVLIDFSSPEGREIAVALITAAGEGNGLFVTNFPAEGFLSHQRLAERRPDLITLRVMGWPDGRNGVDYTVNAAVGVPFLTGGTYLPAERPVNSIIPTWDIAAGALGAFYLLAAERRRRLTGEGGEVRLALSDIAIGTLANLGQVAEAMTQGVRPRIGNALYGAFGRDFATADGRRVMITAITPKQWTSLLAALGLVEAMAALEAELGVSFETDEGMRFQHRECIFEIVEATTRHMSYTELAETLENAKACWEPYQTVVEAVQHDRRFVQDNPLFATIGQPSGHSYPVPGSLAHLPAAERGMPVRAPDFGEHTDMVLADLLGMSDAEIGRLHDRGVVKTPK